MDKLEIIAGACLLGALNTVGYRAAYAEQAEISTPKAFFIIVGTFFGVLILWAIVERSSLIFRNKFKGPDTKRQIPPT